MPKEIQSYPDFQRVQEAEMAFHQPDPPNYKGEATREYQKELARQVRSRGQENTLDSVKMRQYTDQDIAMRLMAAGHSPEKTGQTIAKASPEAGRLKTSEQQKQYGKNVVDSVLDKEKCREIIGGHRREQGQKGQEKERRLDRQKLATEISRKPQPKPEPGSGRR